MLLLNRNAFLRQSQRNLLWEYFLHWPTFCSSCTDGAPLLLPKNQLTPSPHLPWGCQTHTPLPCQLSLFRLTVAFAKLPIMRRDAEGGGRCLGRKRSYAKEFSAFPEQGKQQQSVSVLGGREKPAAAPHLHPACRLPTQGRSTPSVCPSVRLPPQCPWAECGTAACPAAFSRAG